MTHPLSKHTALELSEIAQVLNKAARNRMQASEDILRLIKFGSLEKSEVIEANLLKHEAVRIQKGADLIQALAEQKVRAVA
ncbi:hypothetical protein [Roseibium album]|uniref:hypothetical protein n=1 Tax=Roseibium album TaxID=311410 RepID=UPI00391DB13B